MTDGDSQMIALPRGSAPSPPSSSPVRAAPDLWPIWAITAHTAGARVYWLCHILKEPGAERTPFTDPTGMGWEDDLTHARHASELVSALESTWTIVNDCLDRWQGAAPLSPIRADAADHPRRLSLRRDRPGAGHAPAGGGRHLDRPCAV